MVLFALHGEFAMGRKSASVKRRVNDFASLRVVDMRFGCFRADSCDTESKHGGRDESTSKFKVQLFSFSDSRICRAFALAKYARAGVRLFRMPT